MSDKKLDKKLPAIPYDAVINIKLSGRYYNDLKVAFNNFLMDGEDKNSIAKILDNLSNQKITSAKEHRLYFFFILIGNIESEAQEQGLVKYLTLDEINGSAGN